jgi:hypothetical protein
MEKKLLIVVVVVGLCGTALALDPMGPPAAGLGKGQTSVGAEYSYSDMDLFRTRDRADIRNVRMNKIYGNVGYGITDNWNIFGRAGFADFEYERDSWNNGWWDGDDSSSYALGMGTKATFHTDGDVTWGGLAQVSWANFDGKRENPVAGSSPGTFETDIIEFQLAVGPTYRLREGVAIYGGPFLHFVDGEHSHVNSGGDKNNYPIEERSSIGAYIGTRIGLAENSAFTVEYQQTGDAWAVAGGICWRF